MYHVLAVESWDSQETSSTPFSAAASTGIGVDWDSQPSNVEVLFPRKQHKLPSSSALGVCLWAQSHHRGHQWPRQLTSPEPRPAFVSQAPKGWGFVLMEDRWLKLRQLIFVFLVSPSPGRRFRYTLRGTGEVQVNQCS